VRFSWNEPAFCDVQALGTPSREHGDVGYVALNGSLL